MIPNFDEELVKLRKFGPAGFILAFNMTFRGPEYMHSEYPEAWREEYERQNYFAFDPVLRWSLMNSGSTRWSDIGLSHVGPVIQRGRAVGLNYGAVFSVKKDRKRSFMSVARSDRDLSDEELGSLEGRFDQWSEMVTNRASLTDRELAVLRMLRDGEGQAEIAQDLSISESTVKQRAQSAMAKLGASNRTQAVAMALTRGFLD